MPLLDDAGVQDLLKLAHIHRRCGECGHTTAHDYCRSCDSFYWLHAPGCRMYEDHNGHRLTIVPYVERGRDLAPPIAPYIVCPRCGLASHHPMDVKERYCDNCKQFHEDMR